MSNVTQGKVLTGAALLCLIALFLWWPGVALYDSVAQYGQVLSGRYDDWHPPAMARLWTVFAQGWRGTGPMFLLQMLFYWGGIGLIAAGLARRGATKAAIMLLAIGACPLFLAWQAAVLKDSQMLGAMLAATGIVGWHRLSGRRIGRGAVLIAALLLIYATLVRANAAFASVPLAFALAGWPGPRALPVRAALLVAAMAAAILVGGAIGRIGAERSGVARVQPLYDLVGIDHYGGDVAIPGVTREELAQVHEGRCYTPFYWDPLGDDGRCGWLAQRLLPAASGGNLYASWLVAVATHPIAYARHRLGHLNMSERLWTPRGLPSAAPPARSEPNDIGLVSPTRRAMPVTTAAAWLAETPLGWPAVWLVAGLGLLWTAAATAASPARSLAIALGVSALALEASFAVVSIASDLRYHLWSMIAVAIGWVLLASAGPLPRGRVALAIVAISIVAAVAIVARMTLPPIVGGYRAMLG